MAIDLTEVDAILSNMAKHLIPYKDPTEESWDSIKDLYSAIKKVILKVATTDNLPKLIDHITDQIRYQHAATAGQMLVFKQPLTEDHKEFLRTCNNTYMYIELFLRDITLDTFLAGLK